MATYHDIFVAGGFPRHTYNPRLTLQLENKLAEARNNLCKLVAVTGQTKSGKTVLAQQVFPREDNIWVDGGAVSSEEEFWQGIVDQLELFQETEQGASIESTSEISGKGALGGSIGVAKGSAEASIKRAKGKSGSTRKLRKLSSRIVAINGLRGSKIPLVIDDFHYIPKNLQGGLVRALKPLIFNGLPVVIIAIPHRRYDALKVEKEMTGRISPIDIPVWTEDELKYIPEKGFKLLNYDVDESILNDLSDEAIGSPHLMQDFCRGVCKSLGILESSRKYLRLNVDQTTIQEVFRDIAETIGRPIFEKLARGPRQRKDRIQRELVDGRKVDIYQLVLHALAYLRPGLVSLEYEELRIAIKSVSASQIPQLQEVARILKHMATIAATDRSSTPVIEFEEDEKKLHITDPFFAFYLRWGLLAT